MLELVLGSIFDRKCDLLVVPCNSGGGFTRELKAELRQRGLFADIGKVDYGSVTFKSVDHEEFRVVAYAATVNEERRTSARTIENIARTIAVYCRENALTTANVPLLGTGAGWLEPDLSYDAISIAFSDDESTTYRVYCRSEEVLKQLKVKSFDARGSGISDYQLTDTANTILDLAGNLARQSKRSRITSSCLLFALAESASPQIGTSRFVRDVLTASNRYDLAFGKFMKDAVLGTDESDVELAGLGRVSENVASVLEFAKGVAFRVGSGQDVDERHILAALLVDPGGVDMVARSRLEDDFGVSPLTFCRTFREFIRSTSQHENSGAWDAVLLGSAGKPPSNESQLPRAESIEKWISEYAAFVDSHKWSPTLQRILAQLQDRCVRLLSDTNQIPIVSQRGLFLAILVDGLIQVDGGGIDVENQRGQAAVFLGTQCGIGKSTLEGMLVSTLLQEGQEERSRVSVIASELAAFIEEVDRSRIEFGDDKFIGTRHFVLVALRPRKFTGDRIHLDHDQLSIQRLVEAFAQYVEVCPWIEDYEERKKWQDEIAIMRERLPVAEERSAKGQIPSSFAVGSELHLLKVAEGGAFCLRVNDYAQVLANLFRAAEGEFCFALYGHWGRGKTFLFERVGDALPPGYRTVFFSAWKYPTAPEVWIHLYETLARAAWDSESDATEKSPMGGNREELDGIRKKAMSSLAILRTGIAKGGWKPLILAWMTIAFATVPKTALVGLGLDIAEWFQSLVGLSGIVFLISFWRQVRSTKERLAKDYLTGTRHTEKLGLQATIGDDLRWLLEGWIKPDAFGPKVIAVACLLFFTWCGLCVWRCWDHPIAAVLLIGVASVWAASFPLRCEAAGEPPERVLLVVDDLDRCRPAHLLSVMESIKLLLEDRRISGRVQVAMLVEEDILKHAIYENYKHLADKSGDLKTGFTPDRIIRENCEKLFSAHLRLPPLDAEDLHELIDKFVPDVKDEEDPASPGDAPEEEPIEPRHSNTEPSDPRASGSVPAQTAIAASSQTALSAAGTPPSSGPDEAPLGKSADDDVPVSRDGIVLTSPEVKAIKAAIVKQQLDFRRDLGPRAVRAFLFRYQLARLLLAQLHIRWKPAELANRLAQEMAVPPSEKEKPRLNRVAETLEEVIQQVA